MTNALNLIKRIAADENGTALMEYTILLGILVIAVIGIISALGTWVGAQWKALCNNTAKTNC